MSAAAVRQTAAHPVVFVMANPRPEVPVEAVAPHVAIVAIVHSDYPNHRSTTCSHSRTSSRGALDVRAVAIHDHMKLAAAHTLAAQIRDDELHGEYIIPSVFNHDTAPTVAQAAEVSGVARRPRPEQQL